MAGLKQGSTLHNGKYKIVRMLGQGSFGITYLATTRVSMDGQLGKMSVNVNVAIKEFFMADLNNRATDGTSVERTNSSLVRNYLIKFRREAENLSKLNHANIVKVLELFDENNTTYYVMEYIDGETIDEYVKAKGRLEEKEALGIAHDVCSALSHMHSHKMLHLDLKPKNIMRSSEGKVMLIDFGLAKQYQENGEPESSTTLGLGTPGYAPLEQANYKQDGSFPVTLDVYALGASLYKMLTGKTPPEASYILNEGLPISALQQAGISDKVINIVEKAMASRKKDRYPNINGVIDALSYLQLQRYDDEVTILEVDIEATPYIDIQAQKETDMEKTTIAEPEDLEIVTDEEYVDLGLSVKWASKNIGSNNPFDMGKAFPALNTLSDIHWHSLPEDIARTDLDWAYKCSKQQAQMPTKVQWKELIDKCEWRWIEFNGIVGYRITGRNRNSIFLPAKELDAAHYWTSSKSSAYKCLYYLYCNKQDFDLSHNLYENKYHIRPVKK